MRISCICADDRWVDLGGGPEPRIGGRDVDEDSGVEDDNGVRRRGDEGAVVNEWGAAADGGGRCTNVKPGAISVTLAFFEVARGSLGRGSGRTAYERVKDGVENLARGKVDRRREVMVFSWTTDSEGGDRTLPGSRHQYANFPVRADHECYFERKSQGY